MREIKFRAWDGEKFGYVTLHPTSVSWMSPKYAAQYLLKEIDDDVAGVDFQQMEGWQQLTGLNTNGQEVYEGDILESDADWYEVAWCDERGQWEAIGIRLTHETIALCEVVGSETWVQGNLYENPELLKD